MVAASERHEMKRFPQIPGERGPFLPPEGGTPTRYFASDPSTTARLPLASSEFRIYAVLLSHVGGYKRNARYGRQIEVDCNREEQFLLYH